MPVRHASTADLPAITHILNHYIKHTTANFKSLPLSPSDASTWFARFTTTGRYQLVVATGDPTTSTGDPTTVLGFACSQPFVLRDAYHTTVMATVYLHPDHTGLGLGSQLYHHLFDSLAHSPHPIHRLTAGITLPNPASLALHKKFAFSPVGTFTEAGLKFGHYHDVLWLERPLHLH